MFSVKSSSEKHDKKSSFTKDNGFYRLWWHVDGSNQYVGFGQTDVVVDGVPSFAEFHLWPWAHRLLYFYGPRMDHIFPWSLCYARVTGWSTIARPMIFSPIDFGPTAAKIKWVSSRVDDLNRASLISALKEVD